MEDRPERQPRRAIPQRLRHEVVARDGLTCAICGVVIAENRKWPHPLSLSIDHVVPVSLGGTDDADNLRPTHLHCNLGRGNERRQGAIVVIFEFPRTAREYSSLPVVGPDRIGDVYDQAVGAAREFIAVELDRMADDIRERVLTRESTWTFEAIGELSVDLAKHLFASYGAVFDPEAARDALALLPFLDASPSDLPIALLEEAGIDDAIEEALDAVLLSKDCPPNMRQAVGPMWEDDD
jgi:hypothetical protein